MTFVLNILYYIVIFFEGIAFQLASYAYKLFSLMCQLNFNSLYAIVSPLVDRLQAVIIVLVVYKLATALIGMMVNPESAPKAGADLIKNIAITVILLILHNLIFSFMNELSMLILGAPPGYSYTVLNELAGVTGGEEDEGLIMRFVFGEKTDISEVGDYIAFETMSIFLHNTTDTQDVENALYDGEDGYNFMNMYKVVPKIGKTVYYFPLAGLAIALFLVYTFFNLAAEIGIRVFKLLILQMIAPLAIITIITEGKGLKSETWGKFWKQYTSIYLSIFIRVLTTLIITVVISKFITNIGDFFGTTLIGDGVITNGLLLAIVIFAGYKFVLDAPKLLSKVFNFDIGGGSGDGFASFLGGALVGGTTGLLTGVAGGIASARHSGGSGLAAFGNGLAGATAGGLMGLTQGISSGSKGNNIAEHIKNGYGVRSKVTDRSNRWYAEGGILPAAGHAVTRGTSNFFGTTQRDDRMMDIYTEQENAINAYEEAKSGAKDLTHFENAAKAGKIKDIATGAIPNGSSIYSSGYDEVKFGDSAESYAQSMLEYDKTYQDAMARLEVAKNITLDKTATDSEKQAVADGIANASRDVAAAQKQAKDRAIAAWKSKRDSQTLSSSEQAEAAFQHQKASRNLTEKQAAANRSLSRTEGRRAENATIDSKGELRRIYQGKQNIQNSNSYQQTHKK